MNVHRPRLTRVVPLLTGGFIALAVGVLTAIPAVAQVDSTGSDAFEVTGR
jgi:hypothetical protein